MAVRCQRNLHPLFLIFPFWLANSANPRASMVGGHYHSHKIKKSDKKGYGMNTQYRVECTSFLLLSFYLVSLFHKSFQNTSYLCSSSEMWDKRWHIVSAMIFWYSLFLCFNLYSSNLHNPPPKNLPSFLLSPFLNVLCFCSISEVWDERWHIVSALMQTFNSPRTT